MPTGGITLLGTFAPFFTRSIDDLADTGIAPFIEDEQGEQISKLK